jgi:putative thioredoxin
MAGAVDLGARQAVAKRREQAAQAGGTGAASAFVFEVTDATFNTDVVARSQSAPVIVDLWAEWCQPCKQLGPVLERLADEAAGDWLLAKVDVDANPQLASALQVQSIPMVVAVIGGQLVDGFLGALPEPQVRQWINQILQVADQLGMPARVRQEAVTPGGAVSTEAEAGQAGAAAAPAQQGAQGRAGGPGPSAAGQAGPGRPGGPGGPPTAGEMLGDQRFETVKNALETGDLDTAATMLEQVLADSPGHPVAKAWLAQVELSRRVSSYDRAKVNRSAQEHPDDPDAQTKAADLELANGQVEESFDRLLGVFQRTAGDERDRVRKHLLDMFDVLPPRDPHVARARSKLSSLLF